MQWRDGAMLRVVREAPRRTASGKILHLHLDKQGQIPIRTGMRGEGAGTALTPMGA